MRPRTSGYTLLELMMTIFIIAILFLILGQVSGNFRAKADFSRCITNLRSLYVAAGSYVSEQDHWPQISPTMNRGGSTAYADAWYDALKKYGIARQVWVCPTIQRGMNNPDLEVQKNHRIDYMATPFDDKPRRAYQWPGQPWFIEKGASHSGGNLLIFADAQTMSMKDALRRTYQPP